MSQFITGLDVGTESIKGIVAEETKTGTLRVLAAFKHPSAGLRHGVIVDPEEVTLVLRDLVVDLERLSRKAVKNIWVNVTSEHVRSRLSRGIAAVARADQVIQRDDVDRVMQASRAVKLSANYIILHNILREYLVDDVGDIPDPVGMVGNRLEASTLIVEAFAPQVNMLVKHLERVGATVGGLIMSPLAAAKSVLTKRQKDLGVLLVDIGFGATSLAVYEEGKALLGKTIPIGSGYVTNDIAIGLKTSIDAAEKIKVTYGCALAKEISRKEIVKLADIEPGNAGEVPRRFIAEITEVRLAEIVELLGNELKSIGRPVQLPGGVVLTGGGVKLAGMTDLVKQELKLPAQIGFPSLVGFEFPTAAHEKLIDDPEFATAVGLVLWGKTEERSDAPRINLGAGMSGTVGRFLKNLMP